MKEDNISQFVDYDPPICNNNTRMGLIISFCSNSNHWISLIPPKLPQILDIYSVVAQENAVKLLDNCFHVRYYFQQLKDV